MDTAHVVVKACRTEFGKKLNPGDTIRHSYRPGQRRVNGSPTPFNDAELAYLVARGFINTVGA